VAGALHGYCNTTWPLSLCWPAGVSQLFLPCEDSYTYSNWSGLKSLTPLWEPNEAHMPASVTSSNHHSTPCWACCTACCTGLQGCCSRVYVGGWPRLQLPGPAEQLPVPGINLWSRLCPSSSPMRCAVLTPAVKAAGPAAARRPGVCSASIGRSSLRQLQGQKFGLSQSNWCSCCCSCLACQQHC